MQEALDRKNMLAMKLLHYFITEKNYNPVILQGAEDEIWLENLNSDYKIVRIVSNHIHNNEQFDFDLFKTKHVVKKIKRKTFSLNMKVLSIFTDIEQGVNIDGVNNIDCISLFDEKDVEKYSFVIDKFPDINNKLNFSEQGFQLFMKITSDINKKNKTDAEKVDDVFKEKRPIVTYILMGINILVAIIMFFMNQYDYFIQKFSTFGPSIVHNGEWYRLITGEFLHANIFHAMINMYALYIIGPQIEGFMGKTRYLIIYFFSALTASLLSILFNAGASVGASGALFGLLGSLAYFGYHYRVYLGGVLKSQIVPIILINLSIGLAFSDIIDNYAHIGGLIGGIMITIGVGIKYKSTKFEMINGLIVSLISVALLIFAAIHYI